MLETLLPMAINAGMQHMNKGKEDAQTEQRGISAPTQDQIGAKDKAKVSPVVNNMMQEGLGIITQGSPEKRGKEAGETDRAYFDALAPETNPWERIGQGSVGTPIAQAKAAGNQQQKVARMNNETTKDVARIQSNTAQIVAAINAVAPNRQAGVAEGLAPHTAANLDAGSAEKLAKEVLTYNQAITEGHRGKVEEAKANIAELIALGQASNGVIPAANLAGKVVSSNKYISKLLNFLGFGKKPPKGKSKVTTKTYKGIDGKKYGSETTRTREYTQ